MELISSGSLNAVNEIVEHLQLSINNNFLMKNTLLLFLITVPLLSPGQNSDGEILFRMVYKPETRYEQTLNKLEQK